MTRHEAQLALGQALEKVRYHRLAAVVELSPADCGQLYDQLCAAKKYVDGPEAPEVRRLALRLRLTALDLQHMPEAAVHVNQADLLLLCDAVLAFTVESE